MAITPALIFLVVFIALVALFTGVYVMRLVAARLSRLINARRAPVEAIDV